MVVLCQALDAGDHAPGDTAEESVPGFHVADADNVQLPLKFVGDDIGGVAVQGVGGESEQLVGGGAVGSGQDVGKQPALALEDLDTNSAAWAVVGEGKSGQG